MPQGALGFGISFLKFSKSFLAVLTGQNALSLDWDLHGPWTLFLPFEALSDPLHHRWVNQIPQVAPELLLIDFFRDPMPGPQFQEDSRVNRLLLLAGAVFLLWDHAIWCCQNSTDITLRIFIHIRHNTSSGFWAANGPLPVYVAESISLHLCMF